LRAIGRLFVWFVVPVVFAVYLVTLSPTVGLIDSGELAAGCYLLNILHPTGYPLYTMLGRLASLIPVGMVVNRVAVLSAALAACGVGLFLLLGLRLGVSRTVAGAGALVLGFSFLVWAVAVDVEVYALTFVLVLLLWLGTESALRGGYLLVLAYLTGLILTNHLSGTSAVLGAALSVVLSYRGRLMRRIPGLALFFLLGVTPYLFLVLRARAGPLLAWGDPVDIERFWWHVTGKQYRVWMFSRSFAEVLGNAGRGAALLARSLLYVLVPVVFYGAVRLFRRRRNLAIGLAASFVLAFGYTVDYSIPDIESYYLPCLVVLAVFGMVGLDGLMSNVDRRMSNAGRFGVRHLRIVIRQLPWLTGVVALLANFRVAGKQGDYVAHDFAMNTLASAERRATIITDNWDFYAPAFYLQHVERVRPDVCLIDKELLRRSWYFGYLSRAYPLLVERSRAEIESYRQYLDQFEHGRLRDAAEIQQRYIALLQSFLARSPERPAYTTFDADAGSDASQMLAGATRAPVGLLFQIRSDTTLPEFDYRRLVVRTPRHEPDMPIKATLERYRYVLLHRLGALAIRGQEGRIDSLVRWYRSLPLASLAPLPVSP